MSYPLNLSGAWWKLQRGKTHADELRFAIWTAGFPDPYTIPLRREYDAEDRAVVVRVERVIAIRDDWPHIVGDALHDMRAALNHLATQLARRRYQGDPPRKAAKQIQFPIIADEADWERHPHRRHMDPADAELLKGCQPFATKASGQTNIFEDLADLNNVDKHSDYHLMYMAALDYEFAPGLPGAYTDCDEDLSRVGPTYQTHGYDLSYLRFPKANDEVLRIYVTPSGPNPDADLDVHVAGVVAIRESWDVLAWLDSMAVAVGQTLALFGPVPPGHAVTPPPPDPRLAELIGRFQPHRAPRENVVIDLPDPSAWRRPASPDER
jgi:hypothetical protein